MFVNPNLGYDLRIVKLGLLLIQLLNQKIHFLEIEKIVMELSARLFFTEKK